MIKNKCYNGCKAERRKGHIFCDECMDNGTRPDFGSRGTASLQMYQNISAKKHTG